MKSSRFLIEHQCPQCGAPATLEETDHLFRCGFCHVTSYLLSGDFFRYVLPHRAPKERTLVYLPYWRFKGSLFSCVPEGIKHRIVDVSHQAFRSPYFPPSLGLRSQTLKFRFLTPEIDGRFLPSELAQKTVLGDIERYFSEALTSPIYAQHFIGETISQIYSPFYVHDRIFDAVLNKPVSQDLPADRDLNALSGNRPSWQIRFVPALCPACGWDLEGERDSLALLCRNCDSLWLAAKKGFTKLPFSLIPSANGGGTYLPFYRISANVSGIPLASYADLVKVANLPKRIHPEWMDRPFYFWSPAFKVRPEDLLQFSRNLTLSQPNEEGIPELPKGDTHPITLSIQEGLEFLKMTLASFMKPARILFPKLQEIQITPKAFSLIYLPFEHKGSELAQPRYQLCISRRLLDFARHL